MVGEDSRYNYTVVVGVQDQFGNTVENDRVDMPYPRPQIVKTARPDVQEYRVRDGDRWSGIAARFFRGRSDLWWVAAEWSGVIDPFRELATGNTLKIPQFDVVLFDVLTFSKAPAGGRAPVDEE